MTTAGLVFSIGMPVLAGAVAVVTVLAERTADGARRLQQAAPVPGDLDARYRDGLIQGRPIR